MITGTLVKSQLLSSLWGHNCSICLHINQILPPSRCTGLWKVKCHTLTLRGGCLPDTVWCHFPAFFFHIGFGFGMKHNWLTDKYVQIQLKYEFIELGNEQHPLPSPFVEWVPTFNKLAKLGDSIVSYLKLSITDSLSYPLTGVTAIASKKVNPIVYPNSHPKGRKSNPQQPFSLYGIHGTAPIHPSIIVIVWKRRGIRRGIKFSRIREWFRERRCQQQRFSTRNYCSKKKWNLRRGGHWISVTRWLREGWGDRGFPSSTPTTEGSHHHQLLLCANIGSWMLRRIEGK